MTLTFIILQGTEVPPEETHTLNYILKEISVMVK